MTDHNMSAMPANGAGLIVVCVLVRDRGGMPRSAGELAVQPPVVVPVDVFEGGVLDGAEVVPRASVVDQLPFEQAVEALDHGVVVTLSGQSRLG